VIKLCNPANPRGVPEKVKSLSEMKKICDECPLQLYGQLKEKEIHLGRMLNDEYSKNSN
jgi:hypothetical protein